MIEEPIKLREHLHPHTSTLAKRTLPSSARHRRSRNERVPKQESPSRRPNTRIIHPCHLVRLLALLQPLRQHGLLALLLLLPSPPLAKVHDLPIPNVEVKLAKRELGGLLTKVGKMPPAHQPEEGEEEAEPEGPAGGCEGQAAGFGFEGDWAGV